MKRLIAQSLLLGITLHSAVQAAAPAWFEQRAIGGNTIEILETGRKAHDARLRLIAEARHTILFSGYAFKPDSTGRELLKALCDRSLQGLDVRMLLDGFGSSPLKKVERDIRGCGIRLMFDEATHDGLGGALYAIHEKLLITDGERLVIGGTGIADYYRDAHRDSPEWHDLDSEVHGPAACEFHRIFVSNWTRSVRRAGSTEDPMSFGQRRQERSPFADALYGAEPPADCRPVRYGNARILPSYNNPWFDAGRPNLANEIAAIEAATGSIRLYAPYFVPPKKLTRALVAARERGVEVTILTNSPWSNDEMKLIPVTTFQRVGKLLDAGVRIRMWKPESTMHRKGGVFGHEIAYVGSDNLDLRGQNYSSESLAFTDEPRAVATMIEEFDRDLERTIPLTREYIRRDFKERSFFARVGAWILTPFL